MLPDLKTPLLWALGAGLVLALVTAGVERTRAAGARADLAAEKAARAKVETARALAALTEVQRVVALVAEHATHQQEITDGFENAMHTVQAGRDADRRDAERVRRQFAAYVARDRREAATDPAACQRLKDRSEVLAGLAERGRGLLAAGRRVVERRDAEVAMLLAIVGNDRQLLVPVQTNARQQEDAGAPRSQADQ